MPAGRWVILTAGILLAATAKGQDREYTFRFLITDRVQLDSLTRIISIDNVVRDTVTAYANEEQWRRFRRLGYRILDTADGSQGVAPAEKSSRRQSTMCPRGTRRNHESFHRRSPCRPGHPRCTCRHAGY